MKMSAKFAKRLLSVLLCLSMLLSVLLVPVSATGSKTERSVITAEKTGKSNEKSGEISPDAVASVSMSGADDTAYLTLNEAIQAVQSCSEEDEAVVKLLKNVDLDTAYQAITSGVFTIDLNGFEIKSTSQNCGTLDITGGDVTVTDSGTTGKIIGYYAGVKVSDADLTVSCGSIYAEKYGVYAVDGTVAVDGGDISGGETGVHGYETTLNISGGSIGGDTGVGTHDNSTVNISGGTICGEKNYGVIASMSTVTISDGDISGGYEGFNANECTIDIRGGDLCGSCAGVYAGDGSVNISGGSIVATGENSPNGIFALYVNGCSELTVSGGTISGSGIDKYGDYACGIYAFETTVTVSGGSIFGEGVDILTYCPVALTLGEDGEGATFPGGITVDGATVNSVLGDGAAYWQGDRMIVPEEEAAEITGGDVTIKAACTHENATISYTANIDEHIAAYSCCGVSVKELHNPGDDGACTLCGFDPSTVIIISMTDEAGDGWNGGAIEVYENGELIATATVDDGDSATWSNSYDPEKWYEFRWIKGSYDSECSFEILFGLETVFTATGEICNGYENGHRFYVWCSHSYDDGVVTAPTCTEEGYTTYTCTRCGESFDDEFVAALGHDFGDDGVCTVCGVGVPRELTIHMTDAYGDGWNGAAIEVYEEGELIATATIDNGNSATWTGPYDYKKEYTCHWVKGSYDSECSFELLLGSETVFTATTEDCNGFRDGYCFYPVCEHLYDNGVVTAPTCTEEGYTTYTCALCGDRYDDELVAALGHNYGDDGVCTVCGYDPSSMIVINMTDNYGDGWNGNAIDIYEDGELIATVTVETGTTASWEGEYDPEKEYEFYWVQGGYAEECAFTIHICGELFFEAEVGDCDGIGNGAQFTADGIIPGEAEDPDEDMHLFIVLQDAAGNGWGGCGIKVYANGQHLDDITLEEGDHTEGPLVAYSPDMVYEFYWVAGEAPEECAFALLINDQTIYVAMPEDCAEFTDGQLIFSTEGLIEEEEGNVYVGGIALHPDEYLDLDGNVSTTQPEDGYAYYDGATLTLSDFVYSGSVPEGAPAPSLIYTASDALEIELLGENTLAIPDTEQTGISLGILVGSMFDTEKGALTVSGTGTLNMTGSSMGAVMADNVTLDSGTLNITAYAGLSSANADSELTVNGGELNITVIVDEYSHCIRIGHFTVNNGRVVLSNSEYLAIDVNTLTVSGGYLEVKQGGMEACDGDAVADLITLAEGVSITSPEGAVIADTTNSNGLYAQTIHNADGTVADAFVIQGEEQSDCEQHIYEQGCYDWDEEHHYPVCDNCGEIDYDSAEDHDYDNDNDFFCNTCDFCRCTHDGEFTWSAGLTGHSKHCTLCGDYSDPEEHTDGEDEDTLCDVCGFNISTINVYFDNTDSKWETVRCWWKIGSDDGYRSADMGLVDGDIYTFSIPAETTTVYFLNHVPGIPEEDVPGGYQMMYCAAVADKTYVYTPYNVTVSASDNGTVTPSRTTAGEGVMITLTVTPDDGCVLDTLTVRTENDTVETTDKGDGTYTFTMPAGNVTVTATFKTKGWFEIDGNWYYFDEETYKPVTGLSRVPYPTEAINGITYVPDQEAIDYYAGKNETFIDATEGWFCFDDSGLFRYDISHVFEHGGKRMYIENGFAVWNPGLIELDDGYYYFVGDAENGGNKNATGNYYVGKNNTDLDITISGLYTFDENGKLCEYDGIVEIDGVLWYYEDYQIMQGKGLIASGGSFYYVRSDGTLVRGQKYWVANNNGYKVTVGEYEFDEDGKLIFPETSNKNGIYFERGAWYYYEDGKKAYGKGLISTDLHWYDADGNDYWGEGGTVYVRSDGRLATGRYYITTIDNYMGDMDVYSGMALTFDEMGMYIAPKNGICEVDGILRYFINDVMQYNSGVIVVDDNYYYVRSNGEVVRNCTYWITNVGSSGVVAGEYVFDENGVMQDPKFEGEAVLNGIANGYYYEDGKIAYNKGLTYLEAEGCYIYVRSNGLIATGKYWITNHNDLLPAGMYDFGTDGKLYR